MTVAAPATLPEITLLVGTGVGLPVALLAVSDIVTSYVADRLSIGRHLWRALILNAVTSARRLERSDACHIVTYLRLGDLEECGRAARRRGGNGGAWDLWNDTLWVIVYQDRTERGAEATAQAGGASRSGTRRPAAETLMVSALRGRADPIG